jgi:hypothetical protein
MPAYKKEIRDSGLWNVQGVGAPYNPGFLDRMERAVTRSLSD